MKLNIQQGATSVTLEVFVQDSSSSTGAGLTGLAFNTAGLTCYYHTLLASAATAVTLATLAANNTAWTSGGFREIDATNMPGWYRLDIPNAALASGRSVSVHLKGATNMAPLPIEIALTGWNNQDSVRGGMTALPNAAAAANGGLPTVGTSNNVTINGQVKRNAAFNNFTFLMTDSTTHNPKPGLGTSVTPTVSIDGAAFVGTTNGVTEISGGWYKINLSAADLNGAMIALSFTATGADMTPAAIITVP